MSWRRLCANAAERRSRTHDVLGALEGGKRQDVEQLGLVLRCGERRDERAACTVIAVSASGASGNGYPADTWVSVGWRLSSDASGKNRWLEGHQDLQQGTVVIHGEHPSIRSAG
jgi:hypothetical protein